MKKKIANIAWIVSLAIMIFAGGNLIRIYYHDWHSVQYWKQIAEKRDITGDFGEENIIPSLQSLYHDNPDIVGWLKTEDGHIDYPVMQTKSEPEYYLRRNFDREDNSAGVPFADYRCDIVPYQNFNTIIYGHYSNSDAMFRWLLQYAYKNWYEEHKRIRFDTLVEEGEYEVVAAFYLDGTDVELMEIWDGGVDDAYEVYNYISIDSSEGFQRFKSRLEERRIYETEKELTMGTPVITLICCAPEAYSDISENGRFVVVAQKIK